MTHFRLSRRRLLQAAAGLPMPVKARSALTGGAVVLGYYPDWTTLAPDRIDYSLFTHLCHAFARFDADAALVFPNDQQSADLIRQAHARKVKVLLSVGGADSNAAFCRQPVDDLAEVLSERVRALQYDGIDVDWEAPASQADGARITALMSALRKRAPTALLTMAVPASNWSGQWFEASALRSSADWLNVMTYDFAGPWSDTVGHNAPLPAVRAGIDYWRGRGWPASRLTLGIPNYGRRMRATRFGAPAPKGTYIGDEVSFNEVLALRRSGWKPMLDSTAQSPYLVKPDGGELISYDDENSVRRKARTARTSGLRGYFFWEISSDFDGQTHQLARAAREGWLEDVSTLHP